MDGLMEEDSEEDSQRHLSRWEDVTVSDLFQDQYYSVFVKPAQILIGCALISGMCIGVNQILKGSNHQINPSTKDQKGRIEK